MTDTIESKPPVTKKATTKKTSGASVASANDAMKTLLQDLKLDRVSRDKQLGSLMQEISQGFVNIHETVDSRDVRRNQEITQLINSLEKAFTNIESASQMRNHRNDEIMAKLSESMILEHQNLQEEVQGKERLHDKKLAQLDRIHREQVRRTRLIAIPGVITAIVAVVYMFYTVHVMEKAMTSISQDMRAMKGSMDTVSVNTSGMSNNMAYMRRDMGVMTHNVAPAMNGMRQMMPWVPQ